jgi:hypothetical protein
LKTINVTGSPSTVDAISSVELVASKNNNGQICTCTGRHDLKYYEQTPVSSFFSSSKNQYGALSPCFQLIISKMQGVAIFFKLFLLKHNPQFNMLQHNLQSD